MVSTPASSNTLSLAARITCGAVPEACPLWCACTSPAASRLTAVAMGPAWRGTASAWGTSGGAPPATSWTVAPPTAASVGSAPRVSGGSGEAALTQALSSPCPALPGPSPDLLGLVLAAGCRCEAGWTGSNCSEGKSHRPAPPQSPGTWGEGENGNRLHPHLSVPLALTSHVNHGIVVLGLLQQILQTGQLKTIEIHSHTSRGQNSKIKVSSEACSL